ncbi:COR domain-containing protein [Neolewinella lacunae]|uniref:CHAT domain-containing protein n=1 Tax=Neolewinella lacunae TaxID=1517758 RepID=A0A923PRS1_9BACT|nr:COR domain-containing protein [Neolewinella lacunae]MBC6995557.1 CHAT domain-containing protein [Neolewinella lacunae]MDN3635593.1 COR domain-containing protein [Neolewinella lacunae]
MSPETLMEILGTELRPCQEENPARCALADQAGQYVRDDQKQIIALNLFGWADRKDPLPSTDWLRDLPHLQYLNLGNCGLGTLDLSHQTQLRVLFAQSNPDLTALTLPAAFPDLLRVDLSHCALPRLTWPASPALEFLNVSRQKDKSLTEWAFAAACPRLYFCDLSHNGLTAFRLADGFANLGILCLEDNELTEVAFEGALPGLESLRLSENKFKDLPLSLQDLLGPTVNLFLDDNPLSDDYQTALTGTPAENAVAVKGILAARRDSGVGKDDECKVLIVGNGRVGKTTMYRRLNNLSPNEKEKSTHGVIIASHRWPDKDSPYNVQFWDFGGQDIYHATHRLFLESSAVYIVAWDPESEKLDQYSIPDEGPYGVYQNFRLPYWLDYVYRASGGGRRSNWRWEQNKSTTPLLVVQTKKQHSVEDPKIDAFLSNYFEDFKGGLSVESIPKPVLPPFPDGYPTLTYHLKNALAKVKAGKSAAKSWIELRHRLREKQASGEKYLNLEEYEALAAKVAEEYGSLGRDPLEIAKTWLHNTGVVFYQETATGPRIILDQRWATAAIYAILQREPVNYIEEITANNGYFTGTDLLGYWKDHLAKPGDDELFEEFMLRCELAYRVGGKQDEENKADWSDRLYCAPQLLPAAPARTRDRDRLRKNIEQNPGDWWHLQLFNAYLHTGIVRRLIIRLHDPEEKEWVWRSGMILADEEGNQVLVETEESDKTIAIFVPKKSKTLLTDLAKVLKDVPRSDAPDTTWVSPNGREWVDLDLLRENKAAVIDRNGNSAKRKDYEALLRAFGDAKGQGEYLGAEDEETTDPPPLENQPQPQGQPLDSAGISSAAANSRQQLQLTIFKAIVPDLPALKVEDEMIRITRAINYAVGKYIDGEPMGNGESPATRNTLDNLMKTFPAQIIHFVGHGQELPGIKRPSQEKPWLNTTSFAQCGIVLIDRDGKPDFLSEDGLYNLCRGWMKRAEEVFASDQRPKLIVLNACHTAKIAQRVSTLGLAVIGAKGALDDRAGCDFAYRLYKDLDELGLERLPTIFAGASEQARDIAPATANYQLFINGEAHQ